MTTGASRRRNLGVSPALTRSAPLLDVSGFDRRVVLLAGESEALAALDARALRRNRSVGVPRRTAACWRALSRLVEPLDAARELLHHGDDVAFRRAGLHACAIVLGNCAVLGRSWWGWSAWDWARLAGGGSAEFRAAQPLPTQTTVRPFVVALGYLLGEFAEFQHLGHFNRLHLAQLVFGSEPVTVAMEQVAEVMQRWGYRSQTREDGRYRLPGVLAQALLINRSPRLAELSTEAFARLHAHPATTGRHHSGTLYALQRAVAELGCCQAPVRPGFNHAPTLAGVPSSWANYLDRWHDTSTLSPGVRANIRVNMAKAGRWLAAEHPEASDPSQWSRATCAAWVAAVDRMAVGDWVQRRDHLHDRLGAPISPRTKAHMLMGTRVFFRDLQEWEWIPRRFDPTRALAVPRSVAALIGTNPRVIADDVWAKLLWAGLNLQAQDLPGTSAGSYYPLALIRALTLAWLFSGLRSDELSRLRVGCIRWQHEGQPTAGDSREVAVEQAVCLLDVPVHKTGTAFTKPVDPIVGHVIEAWQAERPTQPQHLDRKTSEHVDLLFSIRAHPVAKHYINRTLIPVLCAKAGVPTVDVRGNITSHRARSTIASQLYNAKEPMTLFELQAWLGHRSPLSTQHYAKITPNTLTKAYTEAGYFARNVRTIEVLLDRDAVTSGAATQDQPWQHYDLGHGWCSYSFFEQCPHRMACARCDFYTPKDSTKAQLLEAKTNLQRMLVSIPLTDDERAAIDDGQAALDSLLDRLADVPTPAGPTPRQIDLPATATLLPIIDVRQSKPSGAGTCSLSRVPAATWPYLLLMVVVGSRGRAMLFKVLPWGFRCEEGVRVGGARLQVIVGGSVPVGPLDMDPWHFQAECVEAFVTSWRVRGFSEVTIDNDVGLLERTLSALGRPAWEVTPEDIDRVVGDLAVLGRKPSTRREYVQIFKGFHRFLQVRKAAEIEAAFGVRLVCPVDEFNASRHVGDDSPALLPPPTPERVDQFFVFMKRRIATARKYGPAARDYALFRTLYHCGLRSEEASLLERCDVHFDRGPLGKLHVRFGKGAHTSGPRPRWVPMLDELDLVLRWFLADVRPKFPDSPVLFADESGGALHRGTIRNRLRYLMELEGRPPAERFSPHALRRACATHNYERGVDLVAVQQLLGHWTVSSTMRYVRPSVTFIEDAYQRAVAHTLAELTGQDQPT